MNRKLDIIVAAPVFCLILAGSAVAQCPPGYGADPDSPTGCAAPNGYRPELLPRKGEQRMTWHQYKASHNSFQRSQDMDQQIDNHNVFMVELDLHYDDGGIIVEHHCFDTAGSQSLYAALYELSQARTLRDRVTFIYLQQNRSTSGDGHCYDGWPGRSTYFQDVRNELLAVFPDEDMFYPHAAFVDIDNRRWPSMQELMRRGHNLVVAFHEEDGNGNGAGASEDFFFGVSDANPGTECCNFAFSNTNGGCDGGGSPDPAAVSDRFLSRAYPGGSCSGLCSEQNGGYWNDATSLGYNFIATNCIDNAHTFDYSEVHSPMPTFVQRGSTGRSQRGTRRFPYVGDGGLWLGYRAATSAVHFQIDAGTYRPRDPFVPPGGDLVFDKAVRFEARGGDVTLMAP